MAEAWSNQSRAQSFFFCLALDQVPHHRCDVIAPALARFRAAAQDYRSYLERQVAGNRCLVRHAMLRLAPRREMLAAHLLVVLLAQAALGVHLAAATEADPRAEVAA